MVIAVEENCEFVVPQSRVEALIKEQQKIQTLFNVRINVQNLCEDGGDVRWVTLEGEKMNRRQAMEYVNALVKPEQEYVYKMPLITAYLVENFAIKENLERTTLSLIEIISDDEIKICGSQMAVATALSALEETMRIFGEDAVTNPLQINILDDHSDGEAENTNEADESVCLEMVSEQTEDDIILNSACEMEREDVSPSDLECEKSLCEKLDHVCLETSVVAQTTSGSCTESHSNPNDLDVIKTVCPDLSNESDQKEDNSSSNADDEVNECAELNEPNGPHESLRDFAMKLGYSDKQITQAINKREVVDQNSLLSELVQASSSAKQLEERTPDSTITPQSPLRPDPSNLRPVVIDGSNVAMSHGNHKVFSCRGIGYAVDWFLQRGHRQITIFVPKWRKEASRPDSLIIDQEVLHRLEQDGLLSWTPSRPVNGRRVVCYDDRFIVQLAAETDGVIVSNDNFRDLQNENSDWKKVIQERLLMYSFANDRFMVPDDPSGRHGPRLDEFLCKGSGRPCPYGRKCTYGLRCKYLHPERQKPEDNEGNKRQKEEFNVKSLPEIPYGEIPPSYRNIPPHILSKPLPPLPNEMGFSHQMDQQEGAVGYQDIYSRMHLRLTHYFPPTLRGPRSSQGEPDRRQVNSDPIYQHQRSSGDMSLLPEELHRVMSMPNLDTAGYSKSRRNSLTQVQDVQASVPGYYSSPTASPRNSMCSPAASPRTSLVFPPDFQIPPQPPPRMQSCHPDALSPRGNPPPPPPPQNQIVHAPYEPPSPDPRITQYHPNPRGARQRPMTVYNQSWMLPPQHQPQHNEHPMMHFQGQGPPTHFIPVSASMGLPGPNQYQQRQYPAQCMPQYPNYPRAYYRSRAPPSGDVKDGESCDDENEDVGCEEVRRVELFEKLKEIFGGDEERICKVMEDNPTEMDADKLASLMLE